MSADANATLRGDAQRVAIELGLNVAVIGLVIPGIKGLELVRKLRKGEETVDLSIMPLTETDPPAGLGGDSSWGIRSTRRVDRQVQVAALNTVRAL